MKLAVAPGERRAKGGFPCLNEGTLHGDGNEDAGLADVAVVEEIVGAGLERVGIEQPTVEGNLHAELVLFVTLAAQRDEAGVCAVRVCERRTGEAGERRRLVEVSVEPAEDPVEFGNLDSGPEARIDCI